MTLMGRYLLWSFLMNCTWKLGLSKAKGMQWCIQHWHVCATLSGKWMDSLIETGFKKIIEVIFTFWLEPENKLNSNSLSLLGRNTK